MRKGKNRNVTIWNIKRHWHNKHGIEDDETTEVKLDAATEQLLSKLPELELNDSVEELIHDGGIMNVNGRDERWGNQICTTTNQQCSSCCHTTQHTCQHASCTNWICQQCYDWHGSNNDGKAFCWNHLDEATQQELLSKYDDTNPFRQLYQDDVDEDEYQKDQQEYDPTNVAYEFIQDEDEEKKTEETSRKTKKVTKKKKRKRRSKRKKKKPIKKVQDDHDSDYDVMDDIIASKQITPGHNFHPQPIPSTSPQQVQHISPQPVQHISPQPDSHVSAQQQDMFRLPDLGAFPEPSGPDSAINSQDMVQQDQTHQQHMFSLPDLGAFPEPSGSHSAINSQDMVQQDQTHQLPVHVISATTATTTTTTTSATAATAATTATTASTTTTTAAYRSKLRKKIKKKKHNLKDISDVEKEQYRVPASMLNMPELSEFTPAEQEPQQQQMPELPAFDPLTQSDNVSSSQLMSQRETSEPEHIPDPTTSTATTANWGSRLRKRSKRVNYKY